MNGAYQYTLEKGSKKYRCPACNANKTYKRYINNQKGEYLPYEYGRCDREVKCGYFFTPFNDDFAKNEARENHFHFKKQEVIKQNLSFIPNAVLNSLQKGNSNNIFIKNLGRIFNEKIKCDDIKKITNLYRLGTIPNGYMKGACVFPFIDKHGKIRALQAKTFDGANHTLNTNFVHSLLDKKYKELGNKAPDWLNEYLKNDRIISCLFGDHLLSKFPKNTIGIVEAPKTAIYATLSFGFPDKPGNLLWLAVYNKSSLKLDKIKSIEGRNIIVFPDVDAHEEWKQLFLNFQKQGFRGNVTIADVVNKWAKNNNKDGGVDLADMIEQPG